MTTPGLLGSVSARMEGKMLRQLAAAPVILALCVSAHAQDKWDLEKCRAAQAGHSGHLCTPEHLEADLAVLTAEYAALYDDPAWRPRTPDARDPRTDPALRRFLHTLAENGSVEGEAAMKESEAALKRAEAALYQPQVTSSHESLWRAMETVALKGIKSIAISVEDSDSRDNRCRPSNDALRLAASRPIVDGGIKVVSDLVSPTLYVNVTALSISLDGCAAFLSVSLRDLSYFAASYQQALAAMGHILLMLPWQGDPKQPPVHSVAVSTGSIQLIENGSLVTGPRSGFAERITDALRRTVDEFVTKIKLADQTP
jgi:hypothetical protein